MNVSLHIERLILDSVDIQRGQHRLLQAAVEAELTRLISAGGISPELAGGGAMPAVGAKAIQVNHESGPDDLGRRIAGSVYSGIGK